MDNADDDLPVTVLPRGVSGVQATSPAALAAKRIQEKYRAKRAAAPKDDPTEPDESEGDDDDPAPPKDHCSICGGAVLAKPWARGTRRQCQPCGLWEKDCRCVSRVVEKVKAHVKRATGKPKGNEMVHLPKPDPEEIHVTVEGGGEQGPTLLEVIERGERLLDRFERLLRGVTRNGGSGRVGG